MKYFSYKKILLSYWLFFYNLNISNKKIHNENTKNYKETLRKRQTKFPNSTSENIPHRSTHPILKHKIRQKSDIPSPKSNKNHPPDNIRRHIDASNRA